MYVQTSAMSKDMPSDGSSKIWHPFAALDRGFGGNQGFNPNSYQFSTNFYQIGS
jgi:hypothetical protein